MAQGAKELAINLETAWRAFDKGKKIETIARYDPVKEPDAYWVFVAETFIDTFNKVSKEMLSEFVREFKAKR